MSSTPHIDEIDDYEPRNPGEVGWMLYLAAKDICAHLEHIALVIEGHSEEMGRLAR